MIDKQSLIKWLRGADEIFEALEERGKAYNLCRKWVEEWFCYGKFCITDDNKKFLEKFKLPIFNKEVKSRIKKDLANFLKKEIKNNTNKIAFAFSLYLISWNIRRFETYFKKPNFSFENFFSCLNEVFDEKFLKDLKELREYHLLKDEIKRDLVKNIYKKLHYKLKEIGTGSQNEPIATIKIMHILAPFYIPLLDNPIANALEKEKVCEIFSKYETQDKNGNKKIEKKIDQNSLLKYMTWIKGKFSPFYDDILCLESEKSKSFLKLLDQAFYIRYSIDIKKRLEEWDNIIKKL